MGVTVLAEGILAVLLVMDLTPAIMFDIFACSDTVDWSACLGGSGMVCIIWSLTLVDTASLICDI